MTTCILCFCIHDHTWDGEASMYCEQCSEIRKAARNTVDHIIDTLYLSDMQGAAGFDRDRMCVHEKGPQYEGQCHFMPILIAIPISKMDRRGGLASIEALNAAADVIHEYVTTGRDLLVHCVGGIERSPLTIAWYLVHKANRFTTLPQAYEFIKQQRPVVSERLFWLPDDAKVLKGMYRAA